MHRESDSPTETASPAKVLPSAGDKSQSLKVAFIGLHGIPHTYGGGEEVVRNLAPRLAGIGFDVTVYCRRGEFADRSPYYMGVKRVFVPTVKHKSLGTFLHSGLSMIHAVARGNDVIYVNSLPSGPLTVIPWMLRVPVVINLDGLEWERPKWGRVARTYFHVSRWLALRCVPHLVNDAKHLQLYYRDHFGKESDFIAYGANIETDADPSTYTKFGLKPDGYYLIAARLVPENNAEMIINAYEKTPTGRPLVIAGESNYNSPWLQRVMARAGEQIRFIGHVSDARQVIDLHLGAFAYLHGHSVGGTNPALLKALGCGNCVAAYSSPYNREVLADESGNTFGELFSSEDQLVAILHKLEAEPDRVANFRHKARDRIRRAYTWEMVTDLYAELFRRAALQRSRPRFQRS